MQNAGRRLKENYHSFLLMCFESHYLSGRSKTSIRCYRWLKINLFDFNFFFTFCDRREVRRPRVKRRNSEQRLSVWLTTSTGGLVARVSEQWLSWISRSFLLWESLVATIAVGITFRNVPKKKSFGSGLICLKFWSFSRNEPKWYQKGEFKQGPSSN